MKLLIDRCLISGRWLEALGQSENKDWVFHTCRHTCASRLAEAGATFMEVCDWMGWSLIHQLLKIHPLFPKTKIKMAKKLDNLRDELKVISGGIMKVSKVNYVHSLCNNCASGLA